MGDDIDIRNSYTQTGEATGGLQSTHLSAGGKPLMEVGADGAMHFNTPTTSGMPSNPPAAASATATAPADYGAAQAAASTMVPTPPAALEGTGTGAGPAQGLASTHNPNHAYPPVHPQTVSALQARTLPEMSPQDESGRGDYPSVAAERETMATGPAATTAAGSVESQRGEGIQTAAGAVEAVPPAHGMGYAPFAERKQ